jgi:hypothetical protein
VTGATTSARSRTLRSFAASPLLLAACTVLAAPSATGSTAQAASPGPVIAVDVDFHGVTFSPDGDQSRDRARVPYSIGRRSEVTVKVRRANTARTLVFQEHLGRLAAGEQTWVWNGADLRGRVLRDGRYTATFVADQIAPDGKKRRVTVPVYIDTVFDVPWSPELSSDTVYPETPSIPVDSIGMTLNSMPDDPMTALGKVTQIIKDSGGHVVTQRTFDYHHSEYYESMPLSFQGRDAARQPLPAGTYRLRFTVEDMAGNAGGSKSVQVHVSDKVLVEVSDSQVVLPTGASASSLRGGEVPPVPCGVVVPSEVYADAGAMSYRSDDTCTGWTLSLATASGTLDLSSTLTPTVAPRGVQSAWVSMRGKPTVSDETDTAQIAPTGGYFLPGGGNPSATSAAVTGESVTSTTEVTYPFEPPYFTGYVRSLGWSITTFGKDSYDVAAVTVHFSYLTPQ